MSDKMVHALVYHLFNKYEVSVPPGQMQDGVFKTDKDSWVGLFSVELEMKKRAE